MTTTRKKPKKTKKKHKMDMRQARDNSGMEKPERESNPQPYCYRATVLTTAAPCLPVLYLLIISLLLEKVNSTSSLTNYQITFSIGAST